MSPKSANPAKSDSAAKKSAKPAKAGKEGKEGKTAKAKTSDDDVTEGAEGAETVDQDAIEEAEDEAAAAKGGGSGEGDAALAAASGSGEMSASFKNFRHHPDMENFYRFIYENDLRHEALAIIDKIMVEKLSRRAAGGKTGKGAH